MDIKIETSFCLSGDLKNHWHWRCYDPILDPENITPIPLVPVSCTPKLCNSLTSNWYMVTATSHGRAKTGRSSRILEKGPAKCYPR